MLLNLSVFLSVYYCQIPKLTTSGLPLTHHVGDTIIEKQVMDNRDFN